MKNKITKRHKYFQGYKKLKHVKMFEGFVNEFINGPAPKLDDTFKKLEKWLKDTKGEFTFTDLEQKMSDFTDDFITLGYDKKEGTIAFDNNGQWIGIAKVKFDGENVILPAEWIDAKGPAYMQESEGGSTEEAFPTAYKKFVDEKGAEWVENNLNGKSPAEEMASLVYNHASEDPNWPKGSGNVVTKDDFMDKMEFMEFYKEEGYFTEEEWNKVTSPLEMLVGNF